MVATLQSRGGVLTAEDFAAHRGEEVTPISTNYRGLDVVELPPNGQGLAALVMLNILDRFDMGVARCRSAPSGLHLLIEAGRLAYAMRNHEYCRSGLHDRYRSLRCSTRGFAAKLAGMIDPAKRSPFPKAVKPMGSTVLVCVVDKRPQCRDHDQFAVLGVRLRHRDGKDRHPAASSRLGLQSQSGHPNCIGPSKRPMHTIIPALALRDGRVDMAFGVMGGAYQAMGHAHVISNIVDHAMDLQTAIDWPRVFFEGEQVGCENGVSEEVMQEMRAMGHDVVRRAVPHGGGQAIRIDWDRGVLIGASDPRKDGSRWDISAERGSDLLRQNASELRRLLGALAIRRIGVGGIGPALLAKLRRIELAGKDVGKEQRVGIARRLLVRGRSLRINHNTIARTGTRLRIVSNGIGCRFAIPHAGAVRQRCVSFCQRTRQLLHQTGTSCWRRSRSSRKAPCRLSLMPPKPCRSSPMPRTPDASRCS